MRVVLASASPRRRELLRALIPAFDVLPADIDEPLGQDAVADARALAASKAEFTGRQHPGVVIIAADTIVFDATRLYGKPADAAGAGAMLRVLRGREHQVVTGVAVSKDSHLAVENVVSSVALRALTDTEVDAYVASGSPLDKAGAYAIQDDLAVVERLDGCYCNVVGLPLWRLKGLLEAADIACALPSATYPRCMACPDGPNG